MTIASTSAGGVCRSPGGASHTRSHLGPSAVLLTIEGDVDAANAADVLQWARDCLEPARRLVVDMRGLTFFGTHGFSVLHRINVTCSARGIAVAFIAGREVERVLDICDPGRGLPVVDTVEAAVTIGPAPTFLTVVDGERNSAR